MPVRWITFILALILACSAMAVSVHAGCRKECDERIAECVATGVKKKKCRKQVLRTCRREGLAYCMTPVATFCCVDACPSGDCVIRQRCTAPLGQTCCVANETGLFIERGTCEEYLPTCLVDSCEQAASRREEIAVGDGVAPTCRVAPADFGRGDERMLRHARSARLVDGADEVYLSQIAANVMAAVREDGTSRRATGLDLLQGGPDELHRALTPTGLREGGATPCPWSGP